MEREVVEREREAVERVLVKLEREVVELVRELEDLRECLTGENPSALTDVVEFLRRRGDSPSIDLLVVIIYNYSIWL